MPRAHDSHVSPVVAPVALLKVPVGQILHNGLPHTSLNEPGPHRVQLREPGVDVVPGGQRGQEAFDEAPTTEAFTKVPAGQGMHGVMPGRSVKVPAGHSLHGVLALTAYLPAGHA